MDTIVRWVLRLAGAGMLGATAGIHADLYSNFGYQHIPRIGHLFLALVIGASILGLLVLVTPTRYVGIVALAGAITELLTAAGLITLTHRSLPGLKGFTESSSAPHYYASLTVEIIGIVVLGLLTVISVTRRSPART